LIKVELELVLLHLSNSGWEILLPGIICGAPEKQTATDNVGTARFEKAPRFGIIDSENFPRFWIVPGVVAGNVGLCEFGELVQGEIT